MVRKLMVIGIALVGLTLALGSNAWADPGRGKGHGHAKGYHQKHRVSPGPYHRGYCDRGRHHDRRVVEKHVYHHYPRHDRRVVEKRVYHHYPRPDRRPGGHFNIAVSVIDHAFGVAVAAGGRR